MGVCVCVIIVSDSGVILLLLSVHLWVVLQIWVVPLLVLLEVARVRKGVRAVGTLVRSLPSVDVLVDLEVPVLGEGLPTGRAAKGPLTCVGPQVGLQVGRRAEGLLAETTDALPPLLRAGRPQLAFQFCPEIHHRTWNRQACTCPPATAHQEAGHVWERSTVRRGLLQVLVFVSPVRPQRDQVIAPPISPLLQAWRLIGRLCGRGKQPGGAVVVSARLHQPCRRDQGTMVQAHYCNNVGDNAQGKLQNNCAEKTTFTFYDTSNTQIVCSQLAVRSSRLDNSPRQLTLLYAGAAGWLRLLQSLHLHKHNVWLLPLLLLCRSSLLVAL